MRKYIPEALAIIAVIIFSIILAGEISGATDAFINSFAN